MHSSFVKSQSLLFPYVESNNHLFYNAALSGCQRFHNFGLTYLNQGNANGRNQVMAFQYAHRVPQIAGKIGLLAHLDQTPNVSNNYSVSILYSHRWPLHRRFSISAAAVVGYARENRNRINTEPGYYHSDPAYLGAHSYLVNRLALSAYGSSWGAGMQIDHPLHVSFQPETGAPRPQTGLSTFAGYQLRRRYTDIRFVATYQWQDFLSDSLELSSSRDAVHEGTIQISYHPDDLSIGLGYAYSHDRYYRLLYHLGYWFSRIRLMYTLSLQYDNGVSLAQSGYWNHQLALNWRLYTRHRRRFRYIDCDSFWY